MKLLKRWYGKFEARIHAFGDKSAWFLMLPALLILSLIDLPRTAAILGWMLFAAVLIGFCIQISRIAWSPINLVDLIERAKEDPLACAIIVAAVVYFVGQLFGSLVVWTRP
jgi:hypothetical protein